MFYLNNKMQNAIKCLPNLEINKKETKQLY